MGKLIWGIAACLSANAYGAAGPVFWKEIEDGRALELRQAIRLSSQVKFPAGTRLQVTERAPVKGEGLDLTYIALEQVPCRDPNQAHGLEIVLPKGELDSSRAVGVELGKGCRWGVYVESKDLTAASFLTEDNQRPLVASEGTKVTSVRNRAGG